MQRFRNILAAIDTRFEGHPALEWAARLAEHNQSKLSVVDVFPEIPWPARLALPDPQDALGTLLREKNLKLEELAAPLREKGIEVTIKVLPGKAPFAIMGEVLRARHDLVVRMTKGAHSRGAGYFGTTSKRLLRKCPCPVWLVHPGAPPRFKRVLAAVELDDQNGVDPQLNEDIMDLATSIVQYENGRCHVVHAWKLFADSLMKTRLETEDFDTLAQTAKEQVAVMFSHFLNPYGMNAETKEAHLLNGDPVSVIPELVKDEKIDLMVMGTIAKTNISGMLMGSTAECLLDRVECSILAIKPDGYLSPVMWSER